MAFWLRRTQSFRYAVRGILVLLRTQPNARIHALAALGISAAGFAAQLSNVEWIVLALTIAMVLVAEAINTALEFLADAAIPEQHPLVESCKDVAAGAVLLAAVGAVIVGCILFGSRIS